ncbi:hypothetical protein JW890_00220 [candidate division WOR-3 bacterium]|nr:hypothetical protein [candidate division WOR-3 bacterium]
MTEEKKHLTDGSRIIVESAARSGADVFIGYPITPANLLYLYSSRRFPAILPAPDEITTLQWMAGFSAAGKMPVTATSYPGLALMIESIGMAFMMELPMLIILVQRLGPATGSATCGAQGDIFLLNGINSGGYHVPTFCISDFNDCWKLTSEAVKTALNLRTPVILLTSKEVIMTLQDFALESLEEIKPFEKPVYGEKESFVPYLPKDDMVPHFLHVGNPDHQVRITASTHDHRAALQHSTPEAVKNTKRLREKMIHNLSKYTYFDYEENGRERLVFSFDVSSNASREAVKEMRKKGNKVSLLIAKTLFPIPDEYIEIIEKHKRTVIVEENLTGQYRELLLGRAGRKGVSGVNQIAKLISPKEIAAEVTK